MELTITQRRENRLLERTEVYFTIAHEGSGTPQRSEIRKAVAGALGGQSGIVILDWARAEFGRTATRGYAKVYKAKERAMELETPPILIRNGLREAVKKGAPAAAPPAPSPKKEAKAEPPKREETKPEPPKPEPKKQEAPAKAQKKEAAAAKKEATLAKKEAPAKEKKPAAKKEGK